MATITTAWSEHDHDHAESSLLYAEMTAALDGLAELEGVTIHHDALIVHVAVRLPEELIERERGLRAAWVIDRLASLVENAFAAEGLKLGQVQII